LEFGAWDLFGIWDLEFGISQTGRRAVINGTIVSRVELGAWDLFGIWNLGFGISSPRGCQPLPLTFPSSAVGLSA
jgi:hypothetical protein